MYWIENIQDLQYYHQPPDAPCYCELLVYPNDLQLQGALSRSSKTGYIMKIYVYSADGTTQLQDITSYCEYYFFTNPFTGQTMFNIRLKTFSGLMCSTVCYILRVIVTTVGSLTTPPTGPGPVTVFDKYTERYCQVSCCDVPRDITISQPDITPESGSMRLPPFHPPEDPPILPEPTIPTDQCGEPLIRITTAFTCYDNETGEYYGTPTTGVIGSAAWAFRKITNIQGRIAQRPREITREISYNCELQRSESFRPYLVESFVIFPRWKMDELEGMLHADNIYISDFVTEKEYQFAGGTVCRLVSPTVKCWELFKLETTLQDCTRRQIFGCGESCDNPSTTKFFAIPTSYRGRGFFGENRAFIGPDYDTLLAYYAAQDGVVAVTDLSGDYAYLYKAFSVESVAYIQQSFYMDSPTAPNRIFSGPYVPVELPVCKVPTSGGYTITSYFCPAPVSDGYTITEQPTDDAGLSGFGSWVMTGTAIVTDRIVTLSFEAVNATLTDPDPIIFTGEIIGNVGGAARPLVPVTLSHVQFEQIPVGSYISIDEDGVIRWGGPGMSIDEDGTHIELSGIQYPLGDPTPTFGTEDEGTGPDLTFLQFQITQLQSQVTALEELENGIRVTFGEEVSAFTSDLLMGYVVISVSFNGNTYNTIWTKEQASSTIYFNDLGPIPAGTTVTINFA